MITADTFFSDQKYLFLHNVYSNDQPARASMTSFAVKRNIFRSFFLDFDSDSHMDETMTLAPEIPTPVIPAPAPTIPAPTIPAPTIPAPTIPVPTIHAPANPALMDLDSLTMTPGAMVPYQPQVPHPNLQLPNTEPSNQNKLINITYQSTTECQCWVNMSPDAFYSSCQSFVRENPCVIFFDISSNMAYFI